MVLYALELTELRIVGFDQAAQAAASGEFTCHTRVDRVAGGDGSFKMRFTAFS